MAAPVNRVKLDEEAVDMLTAAINSACSRQFDRLHRMRHPSDSSIGSVDVTPPTGPQTHRQAPPVPTLVNGVLVHSSVVVESEKPKKRRGGKLPAKKARFDENQASNSQEHTGSSQSIQTPSEILGMNDEGVIND